MAIPPVYAKFVMQCQKFMPHQLTTDLVPFIEANNHMQLCQPLLDWIRMVSTYHPIVAPAVNPTLPVTHGVNLELPLSDPLLQNQQWDWASLDLPSLHERTGGVMVAYNASMATLTNNFNSEVTRGSSPSCSCGCSEAASQQIPRDVNDLCATV